MNLDPVEVSCPFYDKLISVLDVCIADPKGERIACPFKVGLDRGYLLCNFSEQDLEIWVEEV
jgi:hypothetical protein